MQASPSKPFLTRWPPSTSADRACYAINQLPVDGPVTPTERINDLPSSSHLGHTRHCSLPAQEVYVSNQATCAGSVSAEQALQCQLALASTRA